MKEHMTTAECKATADRLFSQLVNLYEDAAGLALQGLAKGRGNVAAFRHGGELVIGFSVGNADVPDAIDRESGLAFYVQCAHGHELFSDRSGGEDAIATWLHRQDINAPELARLIEASREDEEGYVLGELQDAVLAHPEALEALRNEVVAALKKDVEHHKSELAEAVLALADAQGEE